MRAARPKVRDESSQSRPSQVKSGFFAAVPAFSAVVIAPVVAYRRFRPSRVGADVRFLFSFVFVVSSHRCSVIVLYRVRLAVVRLLFCCVVEVVSPSVPNVQIGARVGGK